MHTFLTNRISTAVVTNVKRTLKQEIKFCTHQERRKHCPQSMHKFVIIASNTLNIQLRTITANFQYNKGCCSLSFVMV